MLIAIEGIDGAGKQTLTDALETGIEHAGRSVARIGFPRYESSPFGASIGAALDGTDATLLASVEAMSVSYAADRWQYWFVDRVALGHTAATVTLADRWCASNAAYGAARTTQAPDPSTGFQDWVYRLEFETYGLPTPALTVLLATDSGLAEQRRTSRDGEGGDAYEADGGLQQRALQNYRELATSQWGGPWIVVDPIEPGGARKPASDLAAEVITRLALT